MGKKLIPAFSILTVALWLGWWLREWAATDTCRDMGGQWRSPGLCYDATKYQLEGRLPPNSGRSRGSMIERQILE
jgi:hypothetical protein